MAVQGKSDNSMIEKDQLRQVVARDALAKRSLLRMETLDERFSYIERNFGDEIAEQLNLSNDIAKRLVDIGRSEEAVTYSKSKAFTDWNSQLEDSDTAFTVSSLVASISAHSEDMAAKMPGVTAFGKPLTSARIAVDEAGGWFTVADCRHTRQLLLFLVFQCGAILGAEEPRV